jgi:hypothetical protein
MARVPWTEPLCAAFARQKTATQARSDRLPGHCRLDGLGNAR